MEAIIPYPILAGKNIAFGVCGSVAIYKSLEVIRNLQKLGANVRVIMSKAAQDFIHPLLFEAISRHQVLTAETQSWGEIPHHHIEIANWADVFLIAPCSANTLNKLAFGIADNVLCESFLAFDKIKLLAPAANTKMLENPTTKHSLEILQSYAITLIPPQCKELACQITGNGALAEPLEITYALIRALLKIPFFANTAVCVSGGGSREAIDDVRFISNASSGKMGASLALAAYFLGAKVCFISSKFPFIMPLSIITHKVESSKEYLQAILKWQETLKTENAYLFMSAAISDYIPKKIQGKLKKQDLGALWALPLYQNQEILATLPKKQKTIGFKLESNSKTALENAKHTLLQKGLDAVCLNTLSNTHNPLQSTHNHLQFITKDSIEDLGFSDKLSLAFKILQQAQQL